MNALWFRYKIRCISAVLYLLLVASAMSGCRKNYPDPATLYPECIGTRDSLNPYHPPAGYSVTMSGRDTFSIKLIFTNYTHTILPTYRWPVWTLWVRSTIGNETRYYKGICNPSTGTDKWYGVSGLLYKGEYASCDFVFDKLTCTETEGSCMVVRAATFDSLDYQFTGKK